MSHHILPLLLGLVMDPVEGVSTEGMKALVQAGDAFLAENAEECAPYCEDTSSSFLAVPPFLNRPSAGCRALLGTNLAVMLPKILERASDWRGSQQRC